MTRELLTKNNLIKAKLYENISKYEANMTFNSYSVKSRSLFHFYNNLIKYARNEINKLEEINSCLRREIHSTCDHDYVTDMIEISEECTKTVCYCIKCELNKDDTY